MKQQTNETLGLVKVIIGIIVFLTTLGPLITAAVVVPVIIPVDNSPAQGQLQQGFPKEALLFSEENNCDLSYYDKTTVNKYSCSPGSSFYNEYVFKIDSNGKIINLRDTVDADFIGVMFVLGIVILFFIGTIFSIISLRLSGGGL